MFHFILLISLIVVVPSLQQDDVVGGSGDDNSSVPIIDDYSYYVPPPAYQETYLRDNLMYQNERASRPTDSLANPTSMSVKLYLSTLSVRESDSTVDIAMWVGMNWYDSRLSWEPDYWYGITATSLRASSVWTPDMFLQSENGVPELSLRASDTIDVSVQSTGDVYYLIPLKINLPANQNGNDFEFFFSAESWTMDSRLLNLTTPQTEVDTSMLHLSSKFELESKQVSAYDAQYPDDPSLAYARVEAKVVFTKKTSK